MDDLISRQALYEKTAEWEAQALHMVEKTMNDEDKTEWRKWSTILTERSAFKFDIADAPSVERKKATLLNANPYGECSNCGDLIDSREGFNYCPNCGAELE